MDSCVYTNISAFHLLPHMYLGGSLQQDNATAHKSAETSTLFLENGVDVLENWPPNWPDLYYRKLVVYSERQSCEVTPQIFWGLRNFCS